MASDNPSSWESTAQQLLQTGEAPGWQAVPSSQQARVYHHTQQQLFIKFFLPGKVKHELKTFLLPFTGRGQLFIRQCDKLRKLGVYAPEVLSTGRVDTIPYVVMKEFVGLGLGTLLANLPRSSGSGSLLRWKRNLMKVLGAAIADLHRHGVFHGDLRPNNILVSTSTFAPQLCFIDNERNWHLPFIPKYHRIKNLTQLNMLWCEDWKASDRLRFFKEYAEHSKLALHPLLKSVAEKTNARLQGKPHGGYSLSSTDFVAQQRLQTLLDVIEKGSQNP